MKPGEIAAACLVVCAVLLLGWWIIGKPAQDRRAAVQARAGATIAQGQTNAARDAVGVVTDQAARDAATDAQTRKNDADIRSAKGASAPVDPDAYYAGLRALCVRRAYRGSAACISLQHPGS